MGDNIFDVCLFIYFLILGLGGIFNWKFILLLTPWARFHIETIGLTAYRIACGCLGLGFVILRIVLFFER